MLDPRLKEKMSGSYSMLGDLGYQISLNIRKGKDYTHRQKELWRQAILLRIYVSKLFRYITFNATTDKPILWNVTETQVNSWIKAIEKLGDLNRYPVVPTILPKIKPIVIAEGSQGIQGIPGSNGSDANIIVAPDPGETDLMVTEQVVMGVKTYYLSLNVYADPLVTLGISPTVFEVGTTQNFNITISTTKGREPVTAVTFVTPSSLDPDLQGILNLGTINGGSQPVQTVLPVTGVTQDTTYQVEITDGVTPNTGDRTVSFVYPFLFGNNDLTSFDRYTLAKLIQSKATKTVTLGGVDDYFYFGYPSSYGTLTQIKDQNGFDVTSSFITELVNVTSNSLDTNWTVQYRFYRTAVKTTINTKPFTFIF